MAIILIFLILAIIVIVVISLKSKNLKIKRFMRGAISPSESSKTIEESPLSDEERLEYIQKALVGKTLKVWRELIFLPHPSGYSDVFYMKDEIRFVSYRKGTNYVQILRDFTKTTKERRPAVLAEIRINEAETLAQTGEFRSGIICYYIDEPWLEEEKSLEEIRTITRNIEPYFVEVAKIIISWQLKFFYWLEVSKELEKEKKYIDRHQGHILLYLFKKIGFIDGPESDCCYNVLCLRMKEFYLKCKANEANLERYYRDSKKEYEKLERKREKLEKKRGKLVGRQSEKAQWRAIIEEQEIKHDSFLNKKRKMEAQNGCLLENVRKSEHISQDVQDIVWRRDGGRCVKCGSQENLEFDHIIPSSKGSLNTARNLQLLCEKCNREKSNHIG